MNAQGIITLRNTSAVLQAEKALLKAGLRVKLVPTPRQLSKDCGISVRFEWSERNKVETTLGQVRDLFFRVHRLD
jgi:hypothetical protein